MSQHTDKVMHRWPGEALDRVEHIGILLGRWEDRANSRVPERAIDTGNEAVEQIDVLIANAKLVRAEMVAEIEEYGKGSVPATN